MINLTIHHSNALISQSKLKVSIKMQYNKFNSFNIKKYWLGSISRENWYKFQLPH